LFPIAAVQNGTADAVKAVGSIAHVINEIGSITNLALIAHSGTAKALCANVLATL